MPHMPHLPITSIYRYTMSLYLHPTKTISLYLQPYPLIYYFNSLSFIHQTGHSITERDQVGQAGPAFREPTLVRGDPLHVPHMLCDLPQDYLLHNFI